MTYDGYQISGLKKNSTEVKQSSRVADLGWFHPDPYPRLDPTSEKKKPDPDPTLEKKPYPDPTFEKEKRTEPESN